MNSINTNTDMEPSIRSNELWHMLDMIRSEPYGQFAIYGSKGMGKTTFLLMLENELRKQGRTVIWGVHSFRTSRYSLTKNSKIHDASNVIVFIDDYHDSPHRKLIFRDIINEHVPCICTSTKSISDINFDNILKLADLSQEDVRKLIQSRVGELNSHIINASEIISRATANKARLSPGRIVDTLNQYLRENDMEFVLRNGLYQSYIYGRGLDLTCPQELLPKRNSIVVPSEVKNDIKVINRSLMAEVARDSDILYKLSPREFEELVCELFEQKGYRAKLTKQTRDGGKDIIILNNSILGDLVFYAECKLRPQRNPVGVGLVRSFYGTIAADRATAGIMLTSSYFTDPARRFQQQIKAQMSLMDYTELISEIQNGA